MEMELKGISCVRLSAALYRTLRSKLRAFLFNNADGASQPFGKLKINTVTDTMHLACTMHR